MRPAGSPSRSRLRDPRVWLGLAITALFLWLALRDAPFAEVGSAIAHAHWGILLGLSLPGHLGALYLRARRWGHLTEPIQPIETGALFRAVAVGFMANNVFPLRMGEVIRAWYLSREVGAPAGALFATVVLERVIDTVMVIALALGVLAFWNPGGEGGGLMTRAALALLPVALTPLAGLVALRLWPEGTRRLVLTLLRPFPARIPEFVERVLSQFTAGLGALRGGSHLFWIGFDTLAIWLVFAPLPLLAAFLALDLDLGSPSRMLAACWVTLAAVGVAVALPSAPGFFGPYHYACKLALVSFGVAPGLAVAVGTLSHAVFWVTITALGLLVLRIRRTSLTDLDRATAPGDPGPPR